MRIDHPQSFVMQFPRIDGSSDAGSVFSSNDTRWAQIL
jgi:hypothetical protein